jgi:MtrB/PioB family decaheme-associated outer membrane protein
MKTHSPLFLLGALGVLSGASAIAAVDTSQWKCETCPFEKDKTSSVTVDVGVGAVSDDSAKFGDFTGLKDKGAFAVLGGSGRMRGEGGFYGSASASDLGLDSRSLAAEIGQEGLYRLRLGYSEIPRSFGDGAVTPFLGVGGSGLTLPAGYSSAGKLTAADILAAAPAQPIDLESKRSRLDAGLSWLFGPQWSTRVSVRHDVRDGVQRIAGSFFTNASQLAAPVDHVTDQLEVAASYYSRSLQASLAYQASLFRNGQDSLVWANPFSPQVPGSDRGQLALAPDNQFHQIVASGGYEISPTVRASADIAFGRMTQDAAFVAATLNPNLAVTSPASSLQGKANTFNASLRLTAAVTERLRVNASVARDERDNQTASLSYPAVTTDMFLGATPRLNQPFSFTQDRFRLSADYRGGPAGLKTSIGIDQDNRERTLQEVATTRETTVWGRASARLRENLSASVKLAHAQRDNSGYGVASWISPPENPLLRKFYLAERKRDTFGARADVNVAEGVDVGLSMDLAYDDYNDTTLGLLYGRSASAGADVSAAISDQTQVHAFVQAERVRSRQWGSQNFAQPDWAALSKDVVEVVGVGVKHLAMKGKLELGADVTFSRSRSDVTVDLGSSNPFPTAKTSLDSVRLNATYKLQENLSLLGSYWYEWYEARDWHYDGVTASAVPNLLAFGDPPPRYRVNVLRLAIRYRF